MERRNTKNKERGNGQGTIYFSKALNCYVAQYFEVSGKRKTLKQKKNEKVGDFKKRFNNILSSINQGTYIAKSSETVITIAKHHIENKHMDGTTSDRSYARDLETLEQIKKTCANFCDIPIQKVTIQHIEMSKKQIKTYSNSTINKIWTMLRKVFSIATSPSRKIITDNLMLDENLKKPISEKETKKVKTLSDKEFEKLNKILDNEERNHCYRNIVKMQCISGMRIGEVLARSFNDYNFKTKELNVHNTLTQDQNYKTILGKHTKTYNKKTQIDEGQRYLPLDNNLFLGLSAIIDEQQNKSKIKNIYNLLFWDYANNTFISPSEINSWLTRLNEKYHICNSKLTSHRLRHTALTHWKQIGIDLAVIQYLAGHVEGSSITENVYIETTLDFVKNNISKILNNS